MTSIDYEIEINTPVERVYEYFDIETIPFFTPFASEGTYLKEIAGNSMRAYCLMFECFCQPSTCMELIFSYHSSHK